MRTGGGRARGGWGWLLPAALPLLAFLALSLGRYPAPGFVPWGDVPDDVLLRTILLEVRLPRVLLALLAGAVLAGAGFVFQMVFSNPLIEPGFLGVSQGAALGAATVIVLSGYAPVAVQVAAAGGGLLGLAASCGLARCFRFGGWILRLVLAGMAVSAVLGAGLGFVKLVAEPSRDLQDITFWMMGGLWNASFRALGAVAPVSLASLAVLHGMRWRLNVLSLDDRTAHSVGLSPRRDKTVLLVAAAVGASTVVSVCGLVGWVGLLVPHLARALCGADGRRALPASMMLGAALVLACDTAARTVLPGEVPLGLLTSLLGAAGFCAMISRRAPRRGREAV